MEKRSGVLLEKKCIPCAGNVDALKGEELKKFYEYLDSGWTLIDDHYIEKEFYFSNFREGLAFTIKIGELAESEGHHPDIYLAWGKVKIRLWTHKIKGLSESDFILAAKCDETRATIFSKAACF